MSAESRYLWCLTHEAPGRLWNDGSKACWWESIVETCEDEHEMVPLHEALTKRGTRRVVDRRTAAQPQDRKDPAHE